MSSDQETQSNASVDQEVPPRRNSSFRLIARVLTGIVAAALLLFGVRYLWAGIDFRSECRIAEGAEVCELNFDVSDVGVHKATLTQTAAFPCQQYVRLEPALRPDEDPSNVLGDLRIRVAIHDKDGTQIASCELPDPYASVARPGGVLEATFTPMPVGEYDVVVDVTRATPALAGRPVRLVSGYVLCGIEWMAATFGIAIGTAGTLVGLVVVAVLWFTRRREPHRLSGVVS